MYTIIMQPDKRLTKTVITTLYQNENLVDKFKFIIPLVYEGLNISTFNTAVMYTLPSGEERVEKLHLANEPYKDNWVCGYLPIESKMTKVAGDITVRLIFTDSEHRILQSGTTTITINGVAVSNPNTPSNPEEDLPNDNTNTDGFEVVEF